MRAPDDADLVRAAREGDPAGLGVLLERHRSRLHAVAVGMLGHGPQAEDAVQDAFVIALRRIGELREPSAARAWLTAIAVNVCRARLRRPSIEVAAADPGEARAVPTLRPVEEAVERAALRDWVWAAVERLPEHLRLVVMLRHFAGPSSYEEIAEVCAVPVGTVRSRLSAARARLADELLATAADAHPRARDAGAGHAADVCSALARLERDGDRAGLDEVLAPDVRFTMADRVERRGRDRFAALLARDMEDGVRAHGVRVIAGAEITILEAVLESPPEQPLHCPPGLTQVHFHRDGTTRRIVSHYAMR